MMTKDLDIDGISIVGFRICADSGDADFYTMITYGATEIALSEKGYLYFFTKLDDAEKVFSKFELETKLGFTCPNNVDAICDVAKTLYLLENSISDDSATILDCLNTIFDLFKSIDLQISEGRKDLLFGLADYLTFNRDFSVYFTNSATTKEAYIDSLLWCCGKLLTRSKI